MFFDFCRHLCEQGLAPEATSGTKGKGRKDSKSAWLSAFAHLNSLCRFYFCILRSSSVL